MASEKGKFFFNQFAAAKAPDGTGGTDVTLPDASTLKVGGMVDTQGNARTIEIYELPAPDDLTKCRLFACSEKFDSPNAGARGMIFRGEYDDTATYSPQDVVVIRAGANAGSYVCIASSTGNAPALPDIGNQYWINLNGNSPVGGAWL